MKIEGKGFLFEGVLCSAARAHIRQKYVIRKTQAREIEKFVKLILIKDQSQAEEKRTQQRQYESCYK